MRMRASHGRGPKEAFDAPEINAARKPTNHHSCSVHIRAPSFLFCAHKDTIIPVLCTQGNAPRLASIGRWRVHRRGGRDDASGAVHPGGIAQLECTNTHRMSMAGPSFKSMPRTGEGTCTLTVYLQAPNFVFLKTSSVCSAGRSSSQSEQLHSACQTAVSNKLELKCFAMANLKEGKLHCLG
eukprot:1158687-Pelagomonas_calceolata.AAC.1